MITRTLKVEAKTTDAGVLTYQWYLSRDNITYTAIEDAIDSTYDAGIDAPGIYYYKVIVTNTLTNPNDPTDTSVATATKVIKLNVSSNFEIVLTVETTTRRVGTPITILADGVTLEDDHTYNCIWKDGDVTLDEKSTVLTSSFATGKHTVTCTATDAKELDSSTASTTFTVFNDLANELIYTGEPFAGNLLTFTSIPSYIHGAASFEWKVDDIVQDSVTSTLTTELDEGTHNVSVKVVDNADSATVSSNVELIIRSALVVGISDLQMNVHVGHDAKYTVIVAGGSGTYTYKWTVDGVEVGTNILLTTAFDSIGDHIVAVEVNDGTTAISKSEVITVIK